MISMRISLGTRGAALAFVFAVAAAGCGGSNAKSDAGGGGSGGAGAEGGSTGGAGAGGQPAGGSGGAAAGGTGGSTSAGGAGASDAGAEGTHDGGVDGAIDVVAGDTGSASSGCTGKTYKLCEDFESGTVGEIPTGWTALQGYAPTRGGTVLANDAAHSGTMALKSDGMSTGLDRVQRALASLGPTATKHWGRLFYKVGSPAPKPTSGVIHITMAALEGTTENRVVDTVVAMNGTHQWLFNIPDDSCCAGSDYKWSFDGAWHCAEWNIDVATSSFRFFSDGQEVTQLAFTGKTGAKMSDYKSIGLGTIYYQAPPTPVVMWFDDLAIDDSRVGCL
ncbi:MAG TPA: hypothetical protein VH560_01645 [Polyangia bacterium]|jgi:hypothetical protein|nr:hypothetical protein [Polyangia bacterium]